jgi:type II secretory pathway component GspD/PulD (secretin)
LAPYPHPLAGKIEINGGQGRITLVARDAPLRDVLALLAQSEGLNIVCAEDVNALVSVTLRDVALEDALTALVSSAGCTWMNQRGIIHVSSIQGTRRLSPSVQGRHVRVFRLDYASARDLDLAVKGLLSPVGTSYILETSPLDNRKSAEAIVVEDLAEYLCRVEEYLLQVDQPPRQVSIQAHVLQVELGQNNRHGVNFEHLIQFANKDLRLEMTGFAAPNAPQAFFAQLNGGNLGALIEALCTTNHAKTLASPQVMVVNGQESRIQVGEQLGFRVTTTTETSTLESVEFLDVGVVLTFTPRISRDGHILLRVKPEVSSGQVNPETGLPEEETTEVETDVLLRDGQAIVIGGLIQEKDNETQSKLPFLGDLWLIGKLFQRKQREKSRSEIIVALTPRIVPFCDPLTLQDREAIMRVKTPLFQGALIPMSRPWETQLPDAWSNPAFPQRLPTVEWWEPPLVGEGSPAWLPPTNLPPANLPTSGSLPRGVAPAEELPPAASWEYQPVEPAP